jgi:hypothetical protein
VYKTQCSFERDFDSGHNKILKIDEAVARSSRAWQPTIISTIPDILVYLIYRVIMLSYVISRRQASKGQVLAPS